MTAADKPSLSIRVWIWVKGFPKRHKIITVLVVLYVLFKIAVTPIKNPLASDIYIIRGRFPFEQGFELMFRQNVYGDAPWFRRLCGGIQTNDAICRAGYEDLKPTRLADQHYEIKIYRDRYFAGLADWKDEIWHLQFKAGVGVDPKRVATTGYGDPENSACDGGDAALAKRHNELFCMDQSPRKLFRGGGYVYDGGHKTYKHLVIAEGQPVGPNERLQNFWLYTELDAMLSGGKPASSIDFPKSVEITK